MKCFQSATDIDPCETLAQEGKQQSLVSTSPKREVEVGLRADGGTKAECSIELETASFVPDPHGEQYLTMTLDRMSSD